MLNIAPIGKVHKGLYNTPELNEYRVLLAAAVWPKFRWQLSKFDALFWGVTGWMSEGVGNCIGIPIEITTPQLIPVQVLYTPHAYLAPFRCNLLLFKKKFKLKRV